MLQVSERDIQSACIEWLELQGWQVIRLNSGMSFAEHNGKKRAIRMCKPGTPDILAFRPSLYREGDVSLIFVETKKPGKSPTTMQLIRMEELMLYGAACHVVRSLDDLEQFLAEIG